MSATKMQKRSECVSRSLERNSDWFSVTFHVKRKEPGFLTPVLSPHLSVPYVDFPHGEQQSHRNISSI
jgi:hypothetical protein